MLRLRLLVYLFAISANAPALACMSSGPEGFTHGLIWESKQSSIPIDALHLNVVYEGPIKDSWGFTARVISGPTQMQGRVYRFVAESGNSCTGLGASTGYIVVRTSPVNWPVGLNGEEKLFLSAIEYEPSWLNELLRFFGGSSWRYPGDQGPGNTQSDG